MADELLVFDGKGHATLKPNTGSQSGLRENLRSFTMPQELNPEEEDRKQLTGILRSQRIRESLATTSVPLELNKVEAYSRIFQFCSKDAGGWASLIWASVLTLAICTTENLPGN